MTPPGVQPADNFNQFRAKLWIIWTLWLCFGICELGNHFNRTLVCTGVWHGLYFCPQTLKTAETFRKVWKHFCFYFWYASNPTSSSKTSDELSKFLKFLDPIAFSLTCCHFFSLSPKCSWLSLSHRKATVLPQVHWVRLRHGSCSAVVPVSPWH